MSLVSEIRQEKKEISHPNWKEVKVSLLRHDHLCRKSNGTYEKARIREFSKVAGYKIDMKNSIVFLNTGNKKLKPEIKKTQYHRGRYKADETCKRPMHSEVQNDS